MNPWATVTDVTGNNKTIYNAEKYTLHIENQIRREHGKNLRTHYAYNPDGIGANSTKFIQDNASMYHFNGTQEITLIAEGYPTVSIIRIPFKY